MPGELDIDGYHEEARACSYEQSSPLSTLDAAFDPIVRSIAIESHRTDSTRAIVRDVQLSNTFKGLKDIQNFFNHPGQITLYFTSLEPLAVRKTFTR